MRKVLSIILSLAVIFSVVPVSSGQQQTAESRVAGVFVASQYNYGLQGQPIRVLVGNAATGSATVTLNSGTVALPSGALIAPLNVNAPILIGIGSNQETVTPTAVSGCTIGSPQGTCQVTATFANTHGSGEQIFSGTSGLQEAINDAFKNGGGLVVLDQLWLGTNTIITAAVPYASVSIRDERNGITRYWNATPTGAALAVPTTLTSQAACDATHQFCSDATVAGSASYAGGALFGCVAYVDIMGNEGPCSLTSVSFNDVSAKAIDVAAPVASPGAVGYVVYLSLDAGTYAQAYQIPSTSANCTLTTIELTTPACAVANATYGQAVSTFGAAGLFTSGGSQITTIALNTGQHFTKLASVVQTTASFTPVSNSSVTYSYAPSNRIGLPGVSSANVIKYAASASSTAGIPMSIATWTLPAGIFNFIGTEFRVSGKFTWTDGGAADINKVLVQWDAPLSNATTIPTILCDIENTHTAAAAAQVGTYSCTVRVATTGTTGTALVNGFGNFTIATGQVLLIGTANDVAVAPSAATVNWTAPARITVMYFNSGATSNPGAQGLQATLEVLN